MTSPTVPAARLPVQARARVSQECILDAAAALLAEREAAGLTMSDVAERAGVSIGSLYRWFPAQSSLVNELAHRHLARGGAAALDAVAGGGGAIECLERALRSYLATASDPLAVEILRAIRQDPALRALDRADSRRTPGRSPRPSGCRRSARPRSPSSSTWPAT